MYTYTYEYTAHSLLTIIVSRGGRVLSTSGGSGVGCLLKNRAWVVSSSSNAKLLSLSGQNHLHRVDCFV